MSSSASASSSSGTTKPEDKKKQELRVQQHRIMERMNILHNDFRHLIRTLDIDTSSSVLQQEVRSTVNASKLVKSCEDTLTLISEMKQSVLLSNVSESHQNLEQTATEMEQSNARLDITLDTFAAELRQELNKLEKEYYNDYNVE